MMMFGHFGRSLWGYAYGHHFFGAPLMPLFSLLVVAGVVLILAWTVHRARHHSHAVAPATPAPHAMDLESIVRERLARGEITREEFDRILPLLR